VVASELAVAESAPVVAVADVERSRTRGYVQGAVVLLAGIAIVWIGLVPMGRVAGIIKVPVVLLGILAMYKGIDQIAKAARGPFFETAFWACAIWLGLLILAAIFADFLPLGEAVDTTKTITIPGNQPPDLFSAHPLGTNNFSLDLLARSIYAARVSLLTAGFAVLVSLIIGGAIGMWSGYFGGATDRVIGVFTDSFLAFPALVLLIALAAVLGVPKTVPEAIFKEGAALALIGIPTMIRLARANTMVFAQREFVVASRSLGARDSRILLREILPNVLLPLISFALIVVAVLIVAEGSLAFLGLGLQPPQPSWGNMIAEGTIDVIQQHPFIPLVPGVFMFLTVFAFNRVGDRARRRWDPRQAKI
jgi:peptide/nickel transport system permease protein